MDVNPVRLEVFKNRFVSIAEEMGVALMRTGFSPNIKERRDFSCALFDAGGDMVAQAAHIPVHLGSMQLCMRAVLDNQDLPPLEPGDMVALNDPFRGGTHLPDVTLVAPVFEPGSDSPLFYAANRAHHADIGGMSPGSMPLSTSLFQEGLIIPPVKLVRGGKPDPELMRLILANVRTPMEREGDFAAQIMANLCGVGRLAESLEKHGPDTVARYARALIDHAEAVTRAAIQELPDGVYEFEDFLDDDGCGVKDIPIRLRLAIKGDTAELDLRESGDQVRGSVNAVRAIVVSAALYVFRCLITDDIPANAGCLRPLTVLTRPGSVVDARFPAAVAGGNVETSQRIVDVILGALAQAFPEAIPAASQGTMNNLAMGGVDEATGAPFAYYETLAGGMGGSAAGQGASAAHSHMTNTLNTPVEALEYAYPFVMEEYSIRRGSGGPGANPGGSGLVRRMRVRSRAELTVLSERRTRGPYGLNGGQPGKPGRNLIIRNGQSNEPDIQEMPGKFQTGLEPGDVIQLETPGGGGWGKPEDT